MTLRELMTERLHYALSDSDLEEFDISFAELPSLSDEDFLELYEDIFGFNG